MAKGRRKWLLMLVLGGSVYAGWRWLDDDFEDAQGVVNYIWLEKLPKQRTDMIKHFLVLKHRGQRIGVTGRSSQWRHDYELFKWKRSGEKLELHFPQSGSTVERRFRVWNCEGDAPKPFQLCLEMSGGGTKELYYSRKDWVVDPGALGASVEAMADDTPELGGLLPTQLPADPRPDE